MSMAPFGEKGSLLVKPIITKVLNDDKGLLKFFDVQLNIT